MTLLTIAKKYKIRVTKKNKFGKRVSRTQREILKDILKKTKNKFGSSSIEKKKEFSEMFIDVIKKNKDASVFSKALFDSLAKNATEAEHDIIDNTKINIQITKSFNKSFESETPLWAERGWSATRGRTPAFRASAA